MNRSLLAAAFAAARITAIALLGAGLLAAQDAKNATASTTAKKTTPATTTEPQETSGDLQKLEKFEVTGSRIKTVEAEGPSPVKIITRMDIENSGRTNLTDLLRDLPEAGVTGINEGGTTAAVRGSTALNLRDLGANNTLVIVNGRRTVVTANASGGTTFVDLNRFPISMVERVEVLKDGASAVYGADATAGVVNIILRKDFNGAEFGFSYGNPFKSRATSTDVSERAFNFFGGAGSGKASMTVGVSYFTRGALKGIDTWFGRNADLTARYAAKGGVQADEAAAGLFDLRSGTGPQLRISLAGVAAGQTQGVNGVNIPGLPAGTVITRLPGTGGVVPSGAGALQGTLSTATPSFTNAPIIATGGAFNATAAATYVAQITAPKTNPSNLYNFQEFVWLTPEVKRTGMYTTFRYDLAKNIELYAEASYQQNKSHIELAPSPISTSGDNNILIPKTNYWNPFGVDLNFNYRPVDIGARKADITNNDYQILFGARGTILDKFDWDTAYTYGYDDVVDLTSNAISESRLRAQLALSTPAALNPFGGASYKNPTSTLDAIRVQTQKAGNSALDLWDAKISGDLLELPTGTLGAALYTEVRMEKFNVANDSLSTVLDDIIGQVRLANATQSHRTVKSVAGEFRVPLAKPATAPGLYKLDLSVAARFEDFSDGYNSGLKPYFGLRYQPIKDLLIRGSYSKTFRAPTLPQLYGGESQSLPNGLPDLRRPQALTGDPFDGSATQRLVRQGGNPLLTPEKADVYQYGFVYDLPFEYVKGASIGASFFHIAQKDIIAATSTTYIRQNEVGGGTAQFVIRDPGTETYTNNTAAAINVLTGPNGATTAVAPGQTVTVPGRIQSILNNVLNLAYQRVEGYDFEINYKKRTAAWGQFSLRNNLTLLKFYGYTTTVGNTNPTNQVGHDGYPRVKMQSSLAWAMKEYSAGVSASYTSHYGDVNWDGYDISQYLTFGAYVGYDIPAGINSWLDNTRFTVGMDNITDTQPPLYYNGVGYDQSQIGRPVGRFLFASIRKTF
ncbi:MAG TPA: TonB-dependent receptor [Opitutaceae bacterium]|nr:TonB-dependent receptor [Opitutaceae bacterium]HND62212.1 TonB-dependent receptor [Opitutaceae bacterium]